MTLRETFDKILNIVESDTELNDIFTKNLSSHEKMINKQISRLKAYNRLNGSAYRADKDNSEAEAKEHYSHEMDRLISQFFEREYYYSFRKINHSYEYEGKTYYSHEDALETTNRTWDGEGDLLGMLELKLTHMMHNLRESGEQKDLYIDAYRLSKKENASVNDRLWALSKIKNTHFGPNVEDYKNNYRCDGNTESIYRNKLFIGNIDVSKEESDSGLKHFYLAEYKNEKEHYFCLESAVDTQIPSDEIPENMKHYYLDFDRIKQGLPSIEAPQYRTKNQEYTLLETFDYPDFDKCQDYFSKNNIDIDVIENIIMFEQSFDIDWSDYKLLTPDMIKNIHGNIVTIRQLWQLRHDIIKLRALDDSDDKYYGMWKDAPDSVRHEKLNEAISLFLKDREDLYKKVCQQFIDNGRGWWD